MEFWVLNYVGITNYKIETVILGKKELFTLTQILINYIITNINKGNELLKSERRRSQSEYKGTQVNLCNTYPVKVGARPRIVLERPCGVAYVWWRGGAARGRVGARSSMICKMVSVWWKENLASISNLFWAISLRLALVATEVDITLT